jgi:hypothetical protein
MRADFKKSCCIELFPKDNSSALSSFALHGGELGDGLGSLRHGVLGQLTGKHETDGGLDLAGRESGLLVVGGELPEFMVLIPFLLMPVSGWSCLRTEDLVDVGGVGFDMLLASLLLDALGGNLLGVLGRSLLGWRFHHGGNE